MAVVRPQIAHIGIQYATAHISGHVLFSFFIFPIKMGVKYYTYIVWIYKIDMDIHMQISFCPYIKCVDAVEWI